jgi:hypothetical protein
LAYQRDRQHTGYLISHQTARKGTDALTQQWVNCARIPTSSPAYEKEGTMYLMSVACILKES